MSGELVKQVQILLLDYQGHLTCHRHSHFLLGLLHPWLNHQQVEGN
ncbi:hypothetical protein [Aliiglaciecola lipolytica]|nr:hypothetical protein [Aliiglaciecola lipolytica]